MRTRPLLLTAASLLTLLYSGTLHAQSLWSFASGDEYAGHLATIGLPAHVETQLPVILPADTMQSLQSGQIVTLPLFGDNEAEIAIVSERSFLNGDKSLRGIGTDATANGRLTLTLNSRTALGNLQRDEARYHLLTQKGADGNYVGWLYTQTADLPTAIIDFGAHSDDGPELFNLAPVSGGDVSITQTLSTQYATIGDQVTVNFSVTNNLSSTLTDEVATVLFIGDQSDFVGSNSGCSQGVASQLITIECQITSLAPGATIEFDYTVTITAESYPQLPSSVFVGNIFDPADYVRQDSYIFVNQDTLTDSDEDGISDFNELILNTDPNSSASTVGSGYIAEIDLLFLYTRNFVDELGVPFPETEINQLIEMTNGYYQDSGAMVSFRPVHYGLVEYDFNNNIDAAMTDLTDGTGVFSGVAALREAVGADIVVLMDGIKGSDSTCGLGDAPGVGFTGELFHPYSASNEVYTAFYKPGFPAGGGSGCDEVTLAHELGHNLGLNHSRREVGAEAALSWGRGYGVDGSFVTIMAYPARYTDADTVTLFSNPASTDCNGQACGISRTNTEQSADAVHAINHARFQVAAKRSSKLLNVTSISGGSSSLTMYGAASTNGAEATSFSSNAPIDVQATLHIPYEHQGEVGQTYVVISVPGAGLFFVDEQGGYQSWDGEFASLGASTSSRALQARETLVAFDNFVPSQFGVSGVTPTVFFAYGINDFETFVYSSQGITFSIE